MIILKFVTGSFQMQFYLCLVYLSDYRLSDYMIGSQLVENAWPLKPITFEASVIFSIETGRQTEIAISVNENLLRRD